MKEEFYKKLYDECISWIDGDLTLKSKEERESLYRSYSWMFSDDCVNLPTLEPLIVDSRKMTFRERFQEWWMVVCDCSLNPQYFGTASYSHFLNHPYWKGTKKNGNLVYPQRVILALGMMGIFSGIKRDYLHLGDKTLDHPRQYYVDVEKLKEWIVTKTDSPLQMFEVSLSDPPPEDSWVMTSTDDFDYSFVEGDDDKSWDISDKWFGKRQKETLSSLEVIPECYEKAKEFLASSPYQMVNDLDKEMKKKFKVQYRNCKWLVKLHQGKVGSCKVDDKGGRFYSMMVGMAKDYRRNCLRLDGERVVEVDVSSSQPTLIGLKVKKDTGRQTQWLSHCLSGDFYEWVKGVTGIKVKRDKVKKYVMRYLFSCYAPDLPKGYEGEHLPSDGMEGKKGYKRFEKELTSYLKDNDPDVYGLIEDHKRHPYWNGKVWTDKKGKRHYGKWCSGLPVEMQKVEVDYIQTCLSRLPGNVLFYTIHDAICVKESEGEMVKETMEKVSLEMYGERISVKVENTSQDTK